VALAHFRSDPYHAVVTDGTVVPIHWNVRAALVIDDDRGFRALVKTVLRRIGFTVDGASDGREALSMMEQTRYAIILVDLSMPGGMNGVELLQVIRERNPLLLDRVVIVTASLRYTRPDLPSEVRHVMTKPFQVPDLLRLVESIVGPAEPATEP
jgi:CheY-like chemotaxis protein